MKIKCPKCGQHIKCGMDYQGYTVECPECKEPLYVPYIAKILETETADKISNIHANKHTCDDQSTFEVDNTIKEGRISYIYLLVYGILTLPILWGIVVLIISPLIWFSHKYVLSTKKLYVENGFIIRDETTIRIQDIRSIDLKRNFIDLICGTTTVLIGTASTAGHEVILKHIYDGKYLQVQLNEYRDQARYK